MLGRDSNRRVDRVPQANVAGTSMGLGRCVAAKSAPAHREVFQDEPRGRPEPAIHHVLKEELLKYAPSQINEPAPGQMWRDSSDDSEDRHGGSGGSERPSPRGEGVQESSPVQAERGGSLRVRDERHHDESEQREQGPGRLSTQKPDVGGNGRCEGEGLSCLQNLIAPHHKL